MSARHDGHDGEVGASAAEYALLIAGIAAVIVVAVVLMGGSVSGLFGETCDAVGQETSGASCS